MLLIVVWGEMSTDEAMTTAGNKKDSEIEQKKQIRRLRELIAALERRVPRLEREGEVQIAREAAALKQKALERIAELEA